MVAANVWRFVAVAVGVLLIASAFGNMVLLEQRDQMIRGQQAVFAELERGSHLNSLWMENITGVPAAGGGYEAMTLEVFLRDNALHDHSLDMLRLALEREPGISHDYGRASDVAERIPFGFASINGSTDDGRISAGERFGIILSIPEPRLRPGDSFRLHMIPDAGSITTACGRATELDGNSTVPFQPNCWNPSRGEA